MKFRMKSFVNRGNELISKGKTDEAIKLMLRGFQYYSKNVINALFPYSKADAGMLVIVLRHLADQIEQRNSGAKEFAKQMSKILIFPELEEIEKIEKANKN